MFGPCMMATSYDNVEDWRLYGKHQVSIITILCFKGLHRACFSSEVAKIINHSHFYDDRKACGNMRLIDITFHVYCWCCHYSFHCYSLCFQMQQPWFLVLFPSFHSSGLDSIFDSVESITSGGCSCPIALGQASSLKESFSSSLPEYLSSFCTSLASLSPTSFPTSWFPSTLDLGVDTIWPDWSSWTFARKSFLEGSIGVQKME